jgi:hypothetical protein
MWTDALGEVHYEFWDGLRFNGKCYNSVALFWLCQAYGDAQVKDACIHLGCLPYAADLATIKAECQRQEDSYV